MSVILLSGHLPNQFILISGMMTKLYRLGGDEFVVITSNVSRTIANRLIERILLHVSQVQRPVRLSGSIGGVHPDTKHLTCRVPCRLQRRSYTR